MSIILLTILALLTYTAYEIFAGLSGGKIDANLSASIFNGIGFIAPMLFYVVYTFMQAKKAIPTSPKGLLFSIIAGISIALFSVFFVKIFEKGGSFSFVIPFIYGGSIVLVGIISYLFLGEKISLMHLTGLVLTTAGIIIISLK